MADWVIWFSVAGLLVVIELFTGSIYLLMIALGMAAGGVVAYLGFSVSHQLFAAGIVGFAGTLALRMSRLARKKNPAHDPNVNFDIGNTLLIDEWESVSNGSSVSRAAYRGAMWDVELESGAQAISGLFVIRETRANRLIVNNAPVQTD